MVTAPADAVLSIRRLVRWRGLLLVGMPRCTLKALFTNAVHRKRLVNY